MKVTFRGLSPNRTPSPDATTQAIRRVGAGRHRFRRRAAHGWCRATGGPANLARTTHVPGLNPRPASAANAVVGATAFL
jgi:hypothetical protein